MCGTVATRALPGWQTLGTLESKGRWIATTTEPAPTSVRPGAATPFFTHHKDRPMDYTTLKSLHLTTVAISLALFALRGIWMIADSPRLRAPWARVVPHVNDTVLLVSGIALAYTLDLSPLEHGWLAAKIVALLAYIALGTIALKRGRTRSLRIAAWLAALLVFGYIVSVAVAHDPVPFLQ